MIGLPVPTDNGGDNNPTQPDQTEEEEKSESLMS